MKESTRLLTTLVAVLAVLIGTSVAIAEATIEQPAEVIAGLSFSTTSGAHSLKIAAGIVQIAWVKDDGTVVAMEEEQYTTGIIPLKTQDGLGVLFMASQVTHNSKHTGSVIPNYGRTIDPGLYVILMINTDGGVDAVSLYNLVGTDNEIQLQGKTIFTAHLIDMIKADQKNGRTGVYFYTPYTNDVAKRCQDVYADVVERAIEKYQHALEIDVVDSSGQITNEHGRLTALDIYHDTLGAKDYDTDTEAYVTQDDYKADQGSVERTVATGTDDASAGKSILDVVTDALGAKYDTDETEARQVDVSVVVPQIEPVAMRLLLFETATNALKTFHDTGEFLVDAEKTYPDAAGLFCASPHHVEVLGIFAEDSAEISARYNGVEFILKKPTAELMVGFKDIAAISAAQVDEEVLQSEIITIDAAGYLVSA